MADIKIVPLEEYHIPAVWEIEKENFTQPWSMTSFKDMMDSGYVMSFGALDSQGTIIGYALASYVADTGEILDIAVSAESKRRGVGGMLLDAVHSSLNIKGVSECFLEVRENNLPAIALYNKFGYAPVGVRKNYYTCPKENAIMMKKQF